MAFLGIICLFGTICLIIGYFKIIFTTGFFGENMPEKRKRKW